MTAILLLAGLEPGEAAALILGAVLGVVILVLALGLLRSR